MEGDPRTARPRVVRANDTCPAFGHASVRRTCPHRSARMGGAPLPSAPIAGAGRGIGEQQDARHLVPRPCFALAEGVTRLGQPLLLAGSGRVGESAPVATNRKSRNTQVSSGRSWSDARAGQHPLRYQPYRASRIGASCADVRGHRAAHVLPVIRPVRRLERSEGYAADTEAISKSQ